MDEELRKAIKTKGSLQKIPEEDMKKREEEKKKRIEELKILAEKLEGI